jgi:hypothetical protein
VQTSPEHVCRFTATASGGWSTTGGLAVFADYDPADVRVRVERGGRITYDSAQSERAACADNVVRVGDRVTVTLTTHPNNYEDIDVGAGAGYGC